MSDTVAAGVPLGTSAVPLVSTDAVTPRGTRPRHLLDMFGLSADEITYLLREAARMKSARIQRDGERPLAGRVVGLVFEKPSLRTRVSFETAVAHLGGTALFLPGNEVGLGWRETLADFARTMSQYVDALVLRVFKQSTVTAVATHMTGPVINGLSDEEHPCQALGDLLTMTEQFGSLAGRTVAFVGDGNNVAKSLAVGCGRLGVRFVLASPSGYNFDAPFLARYRAEVGGPALVSTDDPVKAVREADVIYTDVWTSMGQEEEREKRLKEFARFQVNAALLARAPSHAKVMHCLPAHRGEEITDDVVDGAQSVVFPQAGNRLHAQKAVLKWLMG
jgi:ornithine carbamoyltransferase